MSTNGSSGADANVWDAIVIGGGPAGSIAALALARRGRRAIVLEKSQFPRFHIGESFLPATFDRLCELGLEPELRKLPHVPKFGAEFVMGYGGKHLEIEFADGFCPGVETFNVERSILDEMLLREAQRGGAEARMGVTVKQILSLADGDVRIQTDAGEIRGRYLLDASGQQTVVGRHLGTRMNAEEPHLRKVAYFNQFENVWRPPGRKDGQPLIAMMDEGWFWAIPLNERRTSVGMVLDADVARRISRDENINSDAMLAWGIARCPAMKERMTNATGTNEPNRVLADFSYRCRPYAGDGYFLIGDAAAFMDPIFSTGVSVAVNGAMAVASYVDDILAGRISAARARKKYISHLEESTATLFQLIRQYYDHSFRELFLNGTGPLSVHKAVIGVLGGNVFPRPPWKLRWRLRLFDYLVKLNRKRQLVPRRRRFSLLASGAMPQTPPSNGPLAASVAEMQMRS
jgi:flavin-dependent dehydrogenase